MSPSHLRVFIIDEHPVTAAGLSRLVELQDGWKVCGIDASCRHAFGSWGRVAPDLVLLEPAVGGMDGLAQLEDIAMRVRVLCISELSEDCLAERTLRAGARGFLMKTSSPEEIVAGMRAVLAGELVLSPRMRQRFIERAAGQTHDEARTGFGQLNNRELQVVRLLGSNRSPREIAHQLRVSEKTVATHRLRIREKLSLRNSSELQRVAARWVEKELLS